MEGPWYVERTGLCTGIVTVWELLLERERGRGSGLNTPTAGNFVTTLPGHPGRDVARGVLSGLDFAPALPLCGSSSWRASEGEGVV